MPTMSLNARVVQAIKAGPQRMDYFDNEHPGLCLRVSVGGKKSWCYLYRYGGRFHRLTLGTWPALSLKEARQGARDARHSAEKGINPAALKKENRQAGTFEALAQEYLDRHSIPKKKSWKEDRRAIGSNLLPDLGNMRAKDITRRDVRALLDKIARRAPVQANRTLTLLRSIFNWAIEEEILEMNPAAVIKFPTEEHARERVLNEAEIKAVWDALNAEKDGHPQHRIDRLRSAAALKTRLLTAQRGGEVMGMAWSEIDQEGNWWTIPGTRTKNKLCHRVPLTEPVLRILDEMKKLDAHNSPYVFPGRRDPSKPLSQAQAAVSRVCKRTGIEFCGHDLRRTAATMMASMGIQRFVIGRVLNHVERGVTRIYDRYSYDAEKRDALERWGRKLAMIVSGLREVSAAEA